MNRILFSAITLCLSAATTQAVTMTMTNALGGVSGGGSFTIGQAGFAQPANNWPDNEHPGLAIDGLMGVGGTKYLNFNQTNTGLIVTPDPGSAGLALDGLSFWTANDSPGRDPTSYEVYGSTTTLSDSTPNTVYPIGSMILLGSGPLSLPGSFPGTDGRDSGPVSPISFTNETAYASYLIVFPTVKSAGYDAENNSMQIGEIIFNGHTPIPEPGVTLLALAGVAGLVRPRRRA
jgi:hypothetical protein